MTGIFAAGAGPAPATDDPKPESAAARIARAFPTPRLYHVVATGTQPSPLDGADLCLGVGAITDLVAKLSEDPAAVAALGKGCTQASERRGDGSGRLELICDKAAGAFATSRLSMSGTPNDLHQHMEVVMDLGPGAPQTMVTDTHMTYIGACPAPMKPGQIRSRSGEISDPMADLAKLGSKLKARTDAAPGK